jgi:hypothetical protein
MEVVWSMPVMAAVDGEVDGEKARVVVESRVVEKGVYN